MQCEFWAPCTVVCVFVKFGCYIHRVVWRMNSVSHLPFDALPQTSYCHSRIACVRTLWRVQPTDAKTLSDSQVVHFLPSRTRAECICAQTCFIAHQPERVNEIKLSSALHTADLIKYYFVQRHHIVFFSAFILVDKCKTTGFWVENVWAFFCTVLNNT